MQEREVEGWAAGLKRRAGRGLRRAGGGRNGEGDLEEWAAAADKQDERANQGGGWAPLLLSSFP